MSCLGLRQVIIPKLDLDKMKKLSLVLCAALLAGMGSKALAQVQDVSFTVAPVAGYTHWDGKLKFDDSPFWGVRAGFGFGPLFEVRGVYERSFDLKSQLKSSSLLSGVSEWTDNLKGSNIDITRYGGELKFNLWSKSFFAPYLTAGGGVMDMHYTDSPTTGTTVNYKEQQIYGAGGIGLKFNFGRRVALSFEGKDIIFNVSKNNRYLSSPTDAGEQLHNWTGQASLDIYFGGRSQRAEDAVSRAYHNMYTSGFRGVKLVLDPGVAYADFSKSSGLEPQWFVGGSAGIDFTSIFGVRGFYYAATQKPNTLSADLNNELRLYGGNFVARLNMPIGLTPYLTLGAGYREVTNDFKPTMVGATPKSGLFLLGGGGLEIPLFKYLSLYGNVSALLSEQENPSITSVTDPADVKINAFYQAGLRINIGRSSRDGRALYQSYGDTQAQEEVARLQESNLEELNALRADYEARIKKLNAELATAVSRRDTVTVTRVLREKSQVSDRITSVDSQTTQLATQKTQPAHTVTLTKAQFDALVDQVVSDLKHTKGTRPTVAEVTESKLSDLDKILLLNALYRNPQAAQLLAQPQVQQVQSAPLQESKVDPNISLVKRLDQVIDRLEAINSAQIQQAADAKKQTKDSDDKTLSELRQQQTAQVQPQQVVVAEQNEKGEFVAQEVSIKRARPTLRLDRIALFSGVNVGAGIGLNVGGRAYMKIRESKFDFVPDFYVNFGAVRGFGLNANVHYNLPTLFSGSVTPYLGVGVGLNRLSGATRFLPNYVVGASLAKVLGGRLFVDYTARGSFYNSQLAVGYRYHF